MHLSTEFRRDYGLGGALLVAGLSLLGGCREGGTPAPAAAIELTRVPEASEGGGAIRREIAGRVAGVRPGQRIVLYAKSGGWWVQPLADAPFTPIRPDATWSNETHRGTEYAALLVETGYQPPARLDTLPAAGGAVVAVAIAAGTPTAPRAVKTLRFSGYDWQVRDVPSDRGGAPTAYDPANAWTDAQGLLHLRIAGSPGQWTSAEVILTRSLGYGTYTFVVRDTAHLEPAAVFSMLTWDDLGTEQSHRELDIEITRWGDPASKNAQYVVQPFYLPANVARLTMPAGRLAHSFRWEPGVASFQTAQIHPGRDTVGSHVFTSGVPAPGGERVRINLYVFMHAKSPLVAPTEVVVERFEYLP